MWQKLILRKYNSKELSFSQDLWFSNTNIFATQCRRPLFQTINSIRSNNLSLKNQRFISWDCKDIVTKNLSLWLKLNSFNKKWRFWIAKICGLKSLSLWQILLTYFKRIKPCIQLCYTTFYSLYLNEVGF